MYNSGAVSFSFGRGVIISRPPITGMNAEPERSINLYRCVSHVWALVVVSDSIRFRRAPWNYAYMAPTHVNAQDLHALLFLDALLVRKFQPVLLHFSSSAALRWE